ncbi:MAG: hypothetical protein IJC71_05000 [Clostridia bacterium]|nr:hypothetical protein [Clostridia bacterium]
MSLLELFLKKSAALLLLTVLLASCTPDSLLAYRDKDARFTAVFSSGSTEVLCDAVRQGDAVTLTIVSPERSQGIAVFVSPASCTVITADGTSIPLSPNAAAGLTAFLDVLYAPLAESPVPVRSEDGDRTILSLPQGTLTLDENLLPCAVECPAVNGEMRTVTVQNYIPQNPTSEGPS